MDKNRTIAIQLIGRSAEILSGKTLDHSGSSHKYVHILGYSYDLPGRDNNPFSIGSGDATISDTIADQDIGHVRAYLLNYTAPLDPKSEWAVHEISTCTMVGIDVVNAGHLCSNQDILCPGNRSRQVVYDLKYIGPAEFWNSYCTHG
jgi:hypothetical protein